MGYLRNVPDPVGPSTITFPASNSPYVALSGLGDPSIWPELRSLRSPEPMDFIQPHQRRHRNGANLKHSETIGGVGGAGMRVHGRKRTWPSKKRDSLQSEEEPEVKNSSRRNSKRDDSPESLKEEEEDADEEQDEDDDDECIMSAAPNLPSGETRLPQPG